MARRPWPGGIWHSIWLCSLEIVIDPCNEFVAGVHRWRWNTKRYTLPYRIAQRLFDFEVFALFDILQGRDFVQRCLRRQLVAHVLSVHDQIVKGKLTEWLGREERDIFQGNSTGRGNLGHLVQDRCRDGRRLRLLQKLV